MKQKLAKFTQKSALFLASIVHTILLLSANSICILPYYEITPPKEINYLRLYINKLK